MSDRSRSSAEFSELTTLVTDGAGAIDSHVVDALVPAKEVLLHDGGELLERPVRLVGADPSGRNEPDVVDCSSRILVGTHFP